eukprot:jgi/Tetstr1/424359/TSEL_014921.t1
MGARMCTLTDLVNEETRLTGCYFDVNPVWTSTACTVTGSGLGGYVSAKGGAGEDAPAAIPSAAAKVRFQ